MRGAAIRWAASVSLHGSVDVPSLTHLHSNRMLLWNRYSPRTHHTHTPCPPSCRPLRCPAWLWCVPPLAGTPASAALALPIDWIRVGHWPRTQPLAIPRAHLSGRRLCVGWCGARGGGRGLQLRVGPGRENRLRASPLAPAVMVVGGAAVGDATT